MWRAVCLVWSVGWLDSIWCAERRAEFRVCRIWGTPVFFFFEWCVWLVRAGNGVYLWRRWICWNGVRCEIGIIRYALIWAITCNGTLIWPGLDSWGLMTLPNWFVCAVHLCRKYSHPSPRLLARSGPSHTRLRLFRNVSLLECQVWVQQVYWYFSFIWNEINSDIVGY